MTLADFTRPQLCLPNICGRDPAAVLSELSRALEQEHVVPASLSLFNVALNQYFFATGDTVGPAAFSLGRLPSLNATAFAIANAREEFWWRNGCAPVSLVFLIASAANEPAAESAIVDGIKQIVDDRALLRRLNDAPDPAIMFSALRRVTLTEPTSGTARDKRAATEAGESSVQTA